MTELLLAALLLVPMGTARVTWYFLTTPHAAYHHGQTPPGYTPYVDYYHLGIAAPASVPFGTRVLLRRVDTGDMVLATVVDRTASGTGWDCWPMTAEQLGYGPAYDRDDVGVIECQVWIVREAQ
jgi:hypothetical protein